LCRRTSRVSEFRWSAFTTHRSRGVSDVSLCCSNRNLAVFHDIISLLLSSSLLSADWRTVRSTGRSSSSTDPKAAVSRKADCSDRGNGARPFGAKLKNWSNGGAHCCSGTGNESRAIRGRCDRGNGGGGGGVLTSPLLKRLLSWSPGRSLCSRSRQWTLNQLDRRPYLEPLFDMPTARHFFSRHALHDVRFFLSITHRPPPDLHFADTTAAGLVCARPKNDWKNSGFDH